MVNLDWQHLPFSYNPTDYNVRCSFKDGKWGKLEVSDSEYLNMHMAAACLHYGQEAFEGLKAYMGKDNRIRLFRWEENAKRMNNSARGVLMPEVPINLFKEAVYKAVKLNEKYVPPYGSGATLYIRPLLIGNGPEVGVRPADEYFFMVFVTPVGPYFKEGFKPVDVVICREYDRTAPLGTGNLKVGGNYAASLRSLEEAHEKGYTTVVYLDSKEKKYIDECGPANFLAIKDNTYITPLSNSILRSITNMSFMELAEDMGMKVERRPVSVDELDTFEEVGMCGTAAVLSPIQKIVDEKNNKVYEYCKDGKPGPVCEKLFNKLYHLQFGDEEDKFGWISFVE